MKNIAIFASPLLFCSIAIAQSQIEGRLMNVKAEPLPFVSVMLFNASDSSFANGGTSDAEGEFMIGNVQNGKYVLVGSFIGYKKSILSKIEILSQGNINVGTLVLEEEATELNGVTVTASKQQFELKQDRIVMHIDAFPAMSGNTALEVLQQTPGLIVNRQNNSISVLGKGEVLVMINNKIQRIPAEVLMARLQTMRAENIESIEVIHQPSARYDASGAAGIINIVLKENNLEGTNSNVTLTGGYGQREKAGFSLSSNSRRGSINCYGDYSYNLNKANRYNVNHFRRYDYNGYEYYHENFVTLRNYSLGQHAINVGLDANVKDKTVIGLLLSGIVSKQVWASNADSKSADYIDGEFKDGTNYIYGTKTDMSSMTANVNLFHKLSSESALNLNIDHAKIHYNNSGYLMNSTDTGNNILYDRSTPMQFWILSLDDVSRIGAKWTMETGIKGVFNDTHSSTLVESNEGDDWKHSDLFGREKVIKERIYAGYLSVKGDLSEKFNAEFGVRYEYYNYLLQSPNESDFNKSFKNPFPVFRLNYKIDSVNTIQLGFNRSITRPSFFSLTSFLVIFDPSLTVYANPQLRPVFTNAVKLAWQHRSVIWSLGYLDRKNQIYFYNTVDKENHLQTSKPTNLDNEDILEASLTLPINPFQWWETNCSLNAFFHKVEDASSRPVVFENDIITYAIQVNSSFLLQQGWSIGMDGMYRSHFLVGDQRQLVWPYLNIGAKKKFFSGSSLSIALQDIMNSAGKIEWEYHQASLGIRTYGHNNFSERQIRLTYALLLGNQKLKERRQRNTGSDDLKNRM